MKNVDSVRGQQLVSQCRNDSEKVNNSFDNDITIDISIVFFILVCMGAVLFSISLFLSDIKDAYKTSDAVVATFAHKCEESDWVDLPALFAKDEMCELKNINFKGTIFIKDSGMTSAKQDMIFVTHPEYSLVFYDSHDVEIVGKLIDIEGKEKIYVEKIRCIGNDASKTVQKSRQKKLKFITKNKQKIFELSNSHSNVMVNIEDVSFVQEDIVYIHFVQNGNEYGVEKLLVIRIDENDKKYSVQKLVEYDLVNNKFMLIDGIDKYIYYKKTTYEYCAECNSWRLVW